MKLKIIFLIAVFLFLLIPGIFCQTVYSLKELYEYDYNYIFLSQSNSIKGTVFLRNVINNRPVKEGKEDLRFMGNFRGGYGNPFKVTGTDNIDDLFRNIVKECLEYSGYKVVDKNDGKSPILDVSIDEFYVDGYMVYALDGTINLKLYNASEKLLLEETAKAASIITLMSMSINDNVRYVNASIERILNKFIYRFLNLFGSDRFVKSVKGEPSNTLNTVDLNKKKLTAIPKDINNPENVSILSIYSNKIEKIENLDKFTSLKYLDLSKNDISKIENLNSLTKLETLFLGSNSIDKLANLNELTNLKILDCNINSISKIENIDKLSNLNWLILSYNDIGKIENINTLANLKWLNLDHNGIKKIENLDNLTNLEMLNLSSNDIAKIENLDKLTNLTYLNLMYNDSITKIENLDKLTNLLYLNLSYNDGIKKIENLDNLTKLKKLDLSYTDIKKLENIDKLVNLEELNICYTNIVHLENLEKLPNLKKLIILTYDITSMSKDTYEYLKAKGWKFEGLSVDEFCKKKFIKIK